MALYELKCPSLDYVYRMTWAEFQLRLIGFNKAEERDLIKIRRLAWVSLIAPHQDPKKLKNQTESKWWQIGEIKKPKVSPEMRALGRKLMIEYEKKLHGKS